MSLSRLNLPDRLGRSVPLFCSRLLTRRNPIGLFYHTVSAARLPHVEMLYGCKSPEAFDLDLAYLVERYRMVTDEEVAAARFGSADLPENAVILTFDDGFSECSSIVRPMLLKYGVPCIFFVITDALDNKMLMFRNQVSLCLDRFDALSDAARAELGRQWSDRLGQSFSTAARLREWIDGLAYADLTQIDRLCERLQIDIPKFLETQRPYMTRQEVLQLHREGFTIGAHTCGHPDLSLLSSWEEVEREIVESCAAVGNLTGQKTVPFAIPFNGLHLDRNRLASVRIKHDFVGLMYDSNNLMRDREFVVNRIWCDTPVGARRDQSNLESLLRRAHAFEPLRALKRWGNSFQQPRAAAAATI